MEGWRVGGLEGWRVGGLEGWRVGGLEGCMVGGGRRVLEEGWRRVLEEGVGGGCWSGWRRVVGGGLLEEGCWKRVVGWRVVGWRRVVGVGLLEGWRLEGALEGWRRGWGGLEGLEGLEDAHCAKGAPHAAGPARRAPSTQKEPGAWEHLRSPKSRNFKGVVPGSWVFGSTWRFMVLVNQL